MRVCDGQFWRSLSGVCGNGIVEAGEECDAADVGSMTCSSDCILASADCADACSLVHGFSLDTTESYSSVQANVGPDHARLSGQFAVFSNDGSFNTNGQITIYQKRQGTWAYTQTLVASDKSDGDRFGYSVAISGNQIVVGAPGNDQGAMTPAQPTFLNTTVRRGFKR